MTVHFVPDFVEEVFMCNGCKERIYEDNDIASAIEFRPGEIKVKVWHVDCCDRACSISTE